MKRCMIIGFMLILVSGAFAGPPWYAPGSYPGGAWAHDASTLMTSIGGGFYQKVTTISAGGDYDWKVSDSGWTNTYPSGMKNSYLTATIGQVVTFWFDTNTTLDGFLPLTNIPYTDYASFGTHSYVAVGDWQSEAGNPGDWDAATTAISLMHDDGLNGDSVAGDSIYTYRAVISTPGSYNYHVALDGAWTRQVGTDGKNGDGSNFPFAVLVVGDTVKFEVETVKGRIKATPTVAGFPGPPWYAIGDVQGATMNTTLHLMYDNGANGDAVASDGIYTKQIEVATYTPGSTHWFSVVDAAGSRYPPSSNQYGCPYYTSYANQTVKLFFDTNWIDSGLKWIPRTKYAYTEATAMGSHTYNGVGNFQSEVGGSDWTPLDPATALHDDGLNGDQTASDNIYTFEGTFSAGGTFAYKVALDNNWTLQIGDDGKSVSGNPGTFNFNANTGEIWRFEADVLKGTIRAYDTANPPQPTSVSREIWMLFE